MIVVHRLEKRMPCCVFFSLVTDLGTLLVYYREMVQFFISAGGGALERLKSLPYAAAVIVSLNSTNAYGAHITLATEFSVSVKAEDFALLVMVENQGDVPAHDVQLDVVLGDKSLVGPVVKKLKVSEQTAVEFSLADVFGIPGRYPVVIRTSYKDANGYRFTALTVGFYDYKSTVMPAVSISGHSISIPVDGKGRMSFVLRNDGEMERAVELELFLPDELSVSDEQSVIKIGPQQQQTLEYEVENYSALADSRYQVSLLGQYEDDGKRFSVAGSAVVHVADNVRSAAKVVWIWVLLGGLLPGVIVFLRFIKQWT